MGSRHAQRVKRALDIAGAAAALLGVVPVMAGVALAVYLDLGWPVLFRQQRPGLGGIPFEFVKFRTMREPKREEERLASDASRLTKLGRWLRASSLDELPSLWNVLRGDMSLVGPRPLLMQYLPRYSARQRLRHAVKPGLTGWAVVSGRNALAWEEKLELDAWYAEHWSIGLDLEILLRTLRLLVLRSGVSHVGHVTMPEFLGTQEPSPGRPSVA